MLDKAKDALKSVPGLLEIAKKLETTVDINILLKQEIT